MKLAALRRGGSLAATVPALLSRRPERIAQRLGALHGLPQKLGQLLALGELDSADRVFAQLTESGRALPEAQARRALEAALGPLEHHFARWSPHAYAASLGQVHEAQLHDGTRVAVKLQYPGVADAVEGDLAALGLLGNSYRGYDLRAWRRTLAEMIGRELDYELEGATLARFGQLTAGDAQLEVPRVVASASARRVLTMTWLEGAALDEARDWGVDERRAASRALVRWFLRGVLEWGLVHGDPHPGNLRYQRVDGGVRLGVLDFGCVQGLADATRGGLRVLLEAVADAQPATPAQWLARYEAMGFSPVLLEPLVAELGDFTRLLLAPFAIRGPFDARAWDFTGQSRSRFGDRRLAFRFAAPADLAFVVRAFLALLQSLKALDAPIDWRPIFDEVRGRTTAIGSRAALALSPAPRFEGPAASQQLHVEVRRADGTALAFSFPARAAANLSALIPPEIVPAVLARGVVLEQLERQAVDSGFAKGPLFSLEEPLRSVRVWLA